MTSILIQAQGVLLFGDMFNLVQSECLVRYYLMYYTMHSPLQSATILVESKSYDTLSVQHTIPYTQPYTLSQFSIAPSQDA